MVKFQVAIVSLISLLIPLTNAFSPSSNINYMNPAAKKVELARSKVQDEYMKMANMQMVAGGAQAEEYYEGMYVR